MHCTCKICFQVNPCKSLCNNYIRELRVNLTELYPPGKKVLNSVIIGRSILGLLLEGHAIPVSKIHFHMSVMTYYYDILFFYGLS